MGGGVELGGADGGPGMKEHGIIFNDEMVRAILALRKTQTRRVIKTQQENGGKGLIEVRPYHCPDGRWSFVLAHSGVGVCDPFRCPYGQPGDRLWVRETCRAEELESGCDGVRYRADNAFIEIENSQAAGGRWCDMRSPCETEDAQKWKPSRFMPRWASRILLEKTGERVERVQEISEEDARNEGCPQCPDCEEKNLCGEWGRGAIDDPLSLAAGGRPFYECGGLCGGQTAKEWFRSLWDSLNAKRGYDWDSNPWVSVTEFKLLEVR